MAFFKKDELRLLWPFYLARMVFRTLDIMWPFYIVYLKGIGLSYLQLGILAGVFGGSRIILEIPTGVVADVFGRKFSTIVGMFLQAVTIAAMGLTTGFLPLVFLFIVWGFAYTLVSGAIDAWIVDLVKFRKRPDLVAIYYTKNHSFTNIALISSGFLGAFIVARYGLGSIWACSAIASALMGVSFMFGKEHFVRKSCGIREHVRQLAEHTRTSMRMAATHKMLRLFFVAMLFFGFSGGLVADNIVYPLLDSVGYPSSLLGLFFSGQFLCGVFVPFLIARLARKAGGHARYLAYLMIIMSALALVAGLAKGLWFTVIACFIMYCSVDFFHPAHNVLFQRHVPSKLRATLTSTESMVFAIGMTTAGFVGGFMADAFGLQSSLLLAAVVIVPAAIAFWKMGKR